MIVNHFGRRGVRLRLVLVLLAFQAAWTLAVPAVAVARPWSEQPRAFVRLTTDAPGDLRAFVAAVAAAGGHVSVVTSTGSAVVYADEATLQTSRVRVFVLDAHQGRIDDAGSPALSVNARRSGEIWNTTLDIEAAPSTDSDEAPRWPDAGPRPGRLHEPPPAAAGTGSSLLPFGAQYFDQGEFMAGSVAVGVWLIESAGPTYEWSTTRENQTVGGIQSALDNWVRKGGPPASLTFFVEVHLRQPVSGVPIENPIGMDGTWVNEVLTNAGVPGADAFDRCFAYNNSIRSAFGTNWCYSIFVVDSSPFVNQGLFAGGGYAFTYYGGPYVWMARNSSWAFNSPNYFAAVPMHESGHIFMATDEYDNVPQSSGYFNFPDLNGATCAMNRNDSAHVCVNTRGQIGWSDADGDGILDVLDTPPAVTLNAYSPDPAPGPNFTWTGSATVTTLPNQNPNSNYFPPHNQTIARLDQVQWRIDGGTWTAAIPLDGAFDDYSEAYTIPPTPLPDGVHVVEARAHTTAGVWNESFARDTVTVLGSPVGVPWTSPVIAAPMLAPPRPQPARGDCELAYQLPRAERVRLEILDPAGRLVRRFADGEVVPEGAHVLKWDGRDESGARARSGVYMIRLATPSGFTMRRLVLLR